MTITSIGTSRTAEIRSRERRYVYAMLIRVVCFVAATLLFHGPARWIAVAVAILMPWLAVVLANQPTVQESRFARFVPAAMHKTPRLERAVEPEVIDVDVELDDIQPADPVTRSRD